jgi:hypothetical protein
VVKLLNQFIINSILFIGRSWSRGKVLNSTPNIGSVPRFGIATLDQIGSRFPGGVQKTSNRVESSIAKGTVSSCSELQTKDDALVDPQSSSQVPPVAPKAKALDDDSTSSHVGIIIESSVDVCSLDKGEETLGEEKFDDMEPILSGNKVQISFKITPLDEKASMSKILTSTEQLKVTKPTPISEDELSDNGQFEDACSDTSKFGFFTTFSFLLN